MDAASTWTSMVVELMDLMSVAEQKMIWSWVWRFDWFAGEAEVLESLSHLILLVVELMGRTRD